MRIVLTQEKEHLEIHGFQWTVTMHCIPIFLAIRFFAVIIQAADRFHHHIRTGNYTICASLDINRTGTLLVRSMELGHNCSLSILNCIWPAVPVQAPPPLPTVHFCHAGAAATLKLWASRASRALQVSPSNRSKLCEMCRVEWAQIYVNMKWVQIRQHFDRAKRKGNSL